MFSVPTVHWSRCAFISSNEWYYVAGREKRTWYQWWDVFFLSGFVLFRWEKQRCVLMASHLIHVALHSTKMWAWDMLAKHVFPLSTLHVQQNFISLGLWGEHSGSSNVLNASEHPFYLGENAVPRSLLLVFCATKTMTVIHVSKIPAQRSHRLTPWC